MSVRKDPDGRRSITVEIEVPGTPEQVWQAIATGPGISSWFVPAQVEEQDGKPVAVTLQFGPGMLSRSVDWDGQLTGAEEGWPGIGRILQLYLAHFRGLHGTSMQFMTPVPGTPADAWAALTHASGVHDVTVGDYFTAPSGSPSFGGIVEYVSDHPFGALLRLDSPCPGLAALGTIEFGDTVMATMTFYLYGDRADAVVARESPQWQTWLQERFPIPTGGEAPAAPH